ncbi:MAG TPA: pyruvate kinase, partial [Polyangiaceae bacterium]|nr:pyruvate kinase [Polyangiaceae bacterium]
MNDRPKVAELRRAVEALAADARAREAQSGAELQRLHPSHRAAARNLLHYLALRQHDLRDLQPPLAALGLSSLGRSEPVVLATLEAVAHALRCLEGDRAAPSAPSAAPTGFDEADRLLETRAEELLGPAPHGRPTRVMVTLAPDTDATTVDALLSGGADAVRINCAKGTTSEWERLIERVREAERRRGRPCPILCDLAGPNPRTVAFGDVPPETVLGRLAVGDELVLAKHPPPPDVLSGHPRISVGCTLPEVLDDLRAGERVFYDDGKLAGVIRRVDATGALVEITFARKDRVKVRAGKGLNFPDSKLGLAPLTAKDREDLAFVARHANMVGLSFLRASEHIELVQAELARLDATELGLVLKIETPQAFRLLPKLLLTALCSRRVGVMVARGDMAIELGFERLAEAQEEILWLCEAAYVPVIWATQVLDVLSRTGQPSRPEVTDAAMSSRAECVMLNQGKHQLEALKFLDHVLARMAEHQHKKRA